MENQPGVNSETVRERGAKYWEQIELTANGIARARRELPLLEQRAAELRQHKTEPPALAARIIMPEGTEAYLSRNHEYLGPAPPEFVADGMEKLESGEYVFYNENDYYWLVITYLPEDLKIEPILPEAS